MADRRADDALWMGVALALATRGRGRTAPNPNVGCVIVKDGRVVGRGWTQPGGRPHAEAVALHQAGPESRGATCYVTLEPCAHASPRGPACSDSLVAAGVARVVAAIGDPDARTDGRGFSRLRDAGIAVDIGTCAAEARRSMAGFLTRRTLGRPHVTLKLATSLDGRIALADGTSRWITGAPARAHVHLERSRHEAILVGRGTIAADAPRLDVRLPGLEHRSPRRIVLSSTLPPGQSRDLPLGKQDEVSREDPGGAGRVGDRGRGDGQVDASDWIVIPTPAAIADLPDIDHLFVEGGAQTAAAFLAADLVDRLLLYRAPVLIGMGRAAIGDIGLTDLADANRRWRLRDSRQLGSDRLEVYERVKSEVGCLPA